MNENCIYDLYYMVQGYDKYGSTYFAYNTSSRSIRMDTVPSQTQFQATFLLAKNITQKWFIAEFHIPGQIYSTDKVARNRTEPIKKTSTFLQFSRKILRIWSWFWRCRSTFFVLIWKMCNIAKMEFLSPPSRCPKKWLGTYV